MRAAAAIGAMMMSAGLGCGGPPAGASEAEPVPDEPERSEAGAEPPATPELASGAFAFEGEPRRVATVRDDGRGLYAIVIGLGTPENAAGAAGAAYGELSGRDAADLVRGFERANHAVHALRSGEGPGASAAVAAAVVVDAEGAHLAHVGNVRVYRLRGRELARLTTDHSIVEDYIRTHDLSPAAEESLRRAGPHRNAVVRALGIDAEVEVTTRTEPVEPGDTLVLVPAAVHLFLDDAAIARLLADAGPDPEAMARRLVEESADDRFDEPGAAVVVQIR